VLIAASDATDEGRSDDAYPTTVARSGSADTRTDALGYAQTKLPNPKTMAWPGMGAVHLPRCPSPRTSPWDIRRHRFSHAVLAALDPFLRVKP
jgi:hypothetical protein